MKKVLELKGIFSETECVCVYLRTKFQVSSVILTSFSQGRGLILPPPPPLTHTHRKTNH